MIRANARSAAACSAPGQGLPSAVRSAVVMVPPSVLQSAGLPAP
jgi:hypothetical protein